MEPKFKNKIAIVTGSSAGIGLAISKLFYRLGATIILNGRSEEKLFKLQKDLEAEKSQGSIRVIEADLSTQQGSEKFIREVPACDILVNNVGIYFPKPFEETTDEDWQRSWDINVMSGVRLTRHYFAGMKRKNWGRVLFISSESGLQVPPEMIHYGVTKTAQIGLARGISELTVGTGITVNSVLVGPTYTEGVEVFVKQMAEQKGMTVAQAQERFFEEIRPTSLLKRFIKPEEVANAVVFLSSDEASAINGAAIRVEGGVVRSIV